jgi:hypothetical protein
MCAFFKESMSLDGILSSTQFSEQTSSVGTTTFRRGAPVEPVCVKHDDIRWYVVLCVGGGGLIVSEYKTRNILQGTVFHCRQKPLIVMICSYNSTIRVYSYFRVVS